MQRFLISLFGLVLLFVVVCPITPTPIAVVDGNAHASHAPVMNALALISIAPPRLNRPTWHLIAETAPLLIGADVLNLTCVRLC